MGNLADAIERFILPPNIERKISEEKSIWDLIFSKRPNNGR